GRLHETHVGARESGELARDPVADIEDVRRSCSEELVVERADLIRNGRGSGGDRGDRVVTLGADAGRRGIEEIGIARDHRVRQENVRLFGVARAADLVRKLLRSLAYDLRRRDEPGDLCFGFGHPTAGNGSRSLETDPGAVRDTGRRGDAAELDRAHRCHDRSRREASIRSWTTTAAL